MRLDNFIGVCLLGLSSAAASGNYSSDDLAVSPPYYPSPMAGRLDSISEQWEDAIKRAHEIVSKMTLVEKVNLTTGIGMGNGKTPGSTGSVERLGIPGISNVNGPLGVGGADLVTSFPPGLSVATSFNKKLAMERGEAIAEETKAKEAHILLGPCIGPIGTRALGGRNWEGFGADPYLQGILGALTVESMQSVGIMTNIKHLIANEQEFFRNVEFTKSFGQGDLADTLSCNIDDRTMHELYLWPFADAIRAGAASIMCSYNQINNTYGCENSQLLNGLVKDELGFQGFIMSDWGATHRARSHFAGLDMTMPGEAIIGDPDSPSLFGANLTAMVVNGTVPVERVDDMATRIMAAYYYVGLDKTYTNYTGPNFSANTKEEYGYEFPPSDGYTMLNQHVNAMTKKSRKVAKQGALESFVLLKNVNKTLPLKQKHKKLPMKMGIMGIGAFPDPDGPNAGDSHQVSNGALGSGWGSGAVDFPYFLTPYDSLNQRGIDEGMSVHATTAQDAIWANDTVYETTDFYRIAKQSDVNIIFGLSTSGEGFGLVGNRSWGDRDNSSMWHDADRLIEKAVKLNRNNIVVVTTVGPTDLERWIDHENVTAVLLNTPTGQDFGPAVTEILFGDENPSGRLPFTIAKDEKEYFPIVDQWPNNSKIAPQDDFTEGLFVDYKHFDKEDIEPRFEFGFGLSYSNWTMSDLEIKEKHCPPETFSKAKKWKAVPEFKDNLGEVTFPDGFKKMGTVQYPWLASEDDAKYGGDGFVYPEGYSADQKNESAFPQAGGDIGGNRELFKTAYKVQAKVKNHGPYKGKYVAQLYIEYPQTDKFPSPIRQLRGFEKVSASRGDHEKVEFDIRARDLAVWDSEIQGWTVQRGKYTIHVGSSSRNLELKGDIEIK